MVFAGITIGIDPYLQVGPVTLAWHGLTIAIGVLIGAWVAARVAHQRGMPAEPMTTVALLAGSAGLIGGRLLYLAEHDQLLRPGEWLGTNGFSFNGGLILAAVAIVVYVRRAGLPFSYLDAIAIGLPLGIAIGRIGDVINGEHYGPPTNFFLGVRNTHPDALVPSPDVAYHSGGLYDLLIGAIVFAIVYPLRHRLRRPTETMWLVMALLGVGRFAEFFARSDSDTIALGLTSAQWTSLAIVVIGVIGVIAVRRLSPAAVHERPGRDTRSPRLTGGRG